MYKNHCKKQRALALFLVDHKWRKTLAKNSTPCASAFFTSHFFTRSSKSGAKPLQKTAHRATTLFSRAIYRLYSSQPQLQNRYKTIAKNTISWSSNCLPRPLLLFGFLSSHAALSTCPNAGSTRPKTGATWLQAGPRRPKTCATWPKTAL